MGIVGIRAGLLAGWAGIVPIGRDATNHRSGIVFNGEYDPAFIHIFGMTFSIAFLGPKGGSP